MVSLHLARARTKGLHLRHRTSLPPLLDGRAPQIYQAHFAQRNHPWWTEPGGFSRPRGRSEEREIPEPPSIPKDPKMPQPVSSRALMTRRTFNLPRADSPLPTPEGRKVVDGRPSAGQLIRQAAAHRPPRPLAATLQERESPELQGHQRFHRSTTGTPASDTSRPASGEGSELCPTRSILRTSRSRERSQQKRVSFSNDCKRAPPASITDLIRTCPDEVEMDLSPHPTAGGQSSKTWP